MSSASVRGTTVRAATGSIARDAVALRGREVVAEEVHRLARASRCDERLAAHAGLLGQHHLRGEVGAEHLHRVLPPLSTGCDHREPGPRRRCCERRQRRPEAQPHRSPRGDPGLAAQKSRRRRDVVEPASRRRVLPLALAVAAAVQVEAQRPRPAARSGAREASGEGVGVLALLHEGVHEHDAGATAAAPRRARGEPNGVEPPRALVELPRRSPTTALSPRRSSARCTPRCGRWSRSSPAPSRRRAPRCRTRPQPLEDLEQARRVDDPELHQRGVLVTAPRPPPGSSTTRTART
jgi:hypothetical protein